MVASALPERRLQRFVDLLLLRYNGALGLFASPEGASAALEALSASALHVWAGGFVAGYSTFRSSWTQKSLNKDDRAILKQIAAVANVPDPSPAIPVLAAWCVRRPQLGRGVH